MLNVRDLTKLNEYVEFCLKNHIKGEISTYTETHHILPRAHFPQYKNFAEYEWNAQKLTQENHYVQHYLLFKQLDEYSMAHQWYAMNNKNYELYNGELILGQKKYAAAIQRRNKMWAEIKSGTVMAKSISTGERMIVSKEEFDNDEDLVGHTKGSPANHWVGCVNILDENGKSIKIPKEDYDPEIHVGHTKGWGMYKNDFGEIQRLRTNDERVLSGEFFGINRGIKYPHTANNRKGQEISIGIFNNKDEMVFRCRGNFRKICKDNKLPLKELTETRSKNTVIVLRTDFDRKCDETRYLKRMKPFQGWYQRKIPQND